MQTETWSLYTFQPGKISPVNQFLAGICIERLIHWCREQTDQAILRGVLYVHVCVCLSLYLLWSNNSTHYIFQIISYTDPEGDMY